MTQKLIALAEKLEEVFGADGVVTMARNEVTIDVPVDRYIHVCETLVERQDLFFEQLIDLCAVDYLAYGVDEWDGSDVASGSGFCRGTERDVAGQGSTVAGRLPADSDRRFAVVLHLLSVTHNQRLRVRTFAPEDDLPMVPSVTAIWASANWYEREAFDLFGVVFSGHPDMRRLLTDYGFVGHPFRKDFPLVGHVEVIYDEQKKRVVYQPVSIEPRTLVARVIREDNRYESPAAAVASDSGEA